MVTQGSPEKKPQAGGERLKKGVEERKGGGKQMTWS